MFPIDEDMPIVKYNEISTEVLKEIADGVKSSIVSESERIKVIKDVEGDWNMVMKGNTPRNVPAE